MKEINLEDLSLLDSNICSNNTILIHIITNIINKIILTDKIIEMIILIEDSLTNNNLKTK